MKAFKQLAVWRKSHKLVLEIYRVTTKFPEVKRMLTSFIQKLKAER